MISLPNMFCFPHLCVTIQLNKKILLPYDLILGSLVRFRERRFPFGGLTLVFFKLKSLRLDLKKDCNE